jgi:signal transduction histidine kinase
MVPLQWFALAASVTLLNGALLGFIAWREQNRTLRLWAWAWTAWGAAVVPLSLIDPTGHAFLAVCCGLLWLVSSLCFLAGTYALVERRMPRGWFAVALGCGAVALALGIGPVGALGMVPLVIFQAVGQFSTGLLLLRAAPGRFGARLAGAALMLLALHLLDAPLLVERPDWMMWGFVLATCLEVLVGLGMLTLYYEHARAELLEAQRVLAETRRVEALGRVAGGVAHDFNNMLTVIQGNLEFIRRDNSDGRSVLSALDDIQDAIDRASRLTAQLLAFGRRSPVQPVVVDARQVVESTVNLLRKVTREDIALVFRAGEGDYQGLTDRTLLEQIVLNLVTNARDAIRQSGTIVVEVERRSGETGEELWLRVADDGHGIEPELRTHIFDPFFTTKGMGKGTGLGLASVHGAVSQLGGRIRVSSEPGHGTSFEVELPLPGASKGRESPHLSNASRPLTILVVDDDESVRAVTARMLELDGHQVTQARDGVAALEALRGDQFDLVLSDVVMPRLGGPALLETIRHRHPGTLVLLTSGFPAEEVATASTPILPKPFTSEALRLAVGHALSERAI